MSLEANLRSSKLLTTLQDDSSPPAGPVVVTTPHLLALCLTQAGEQMDGNPIGGRRGADVQVLPQSGGGSVYLCEGLKLRGSAALFIRAGWSAGEGSADLPVCYQPNTSDHLLPPPPQPLSHSECYFNGKQNA